MNKLYLILLPLIFYPYGNVFEFKEAYSQLLPIIAFVLFTYFFKKFLFKIELKNKVYSTISDRISDLFPIFASILLLLCSFLILSSLKESFGKESLVISICYIIATILSSILYKRQKIALFILVLVVEYFLVSLISFNFINSILSLNLFAIYFSFSCFLVSLKLLDNYILDKINKDFSIKITKKHNLNLPSIVFLLSCFYPLVLSILATTYFNKRSLTLAPFILIFYLFALNKISNLEKIPYIYVFRGIIIILPLVILIATAFLIF